MTRTQFSVCRRVVLAVLFALPLAACQSGHVYMLSRPKVATPCTAVTFHEGDSVIEMEPEYKTHFENQLAEQLKSKGLLSTPANQEGTLNLEYRFVLYDAGHAPTRVTAALINLSGIPTGSLGYGVLGVEAYFRDAQGHEVAHVIADGPIDGFDGSTEGGLETAAESLANFAKNRLAVPTTTPVATLVKPDSTVAN